MKGLFLCCLAIVSFAASSSAVRPQALDATFCGVFADNLILHVPRTKDATQDNLFRTYMPQMMRALVDFFKSEITKKKDDQLATATTDSAKERIKHVEKSSLAAMEQLLAYYTEKIVTDARSPTRNWTDDKNGISNFCELVAVVFEAAKEKAKSDIELFTKTVNNVSISSPFNDKSARSLFVLFFR